LYKNTQRRIFTVSLTITTWPIYSISRFGLILYGNFICSVVTRGIFIFGGGNKRLRNVTKMYCQCQISHKRRKKECVGKFKFSQNRLKKQILRKPILVSASKGKVIFI
jgi:hypothetical protein